MKPLIEKLNANPKGVFLTDGAGALLTAFLLGVVLASFENTFGMPRNVLYFLSVLGCVYAAYSICCCLLVTDNWRFYLKIIAIANLLYCCLTAALVVFFYKHITIWGLTYFLSEIAVIIVLVRVEFMLISRRT
ncbi:MAG: hypothetical protein MUD08_14245 [Cytophagales bacterium]|nr:hypothetical protein [Cytophagales bacterium]